MKLASSLVLSVSIAALAPLACTNTTTPISVAEGCPPINVVYHSSSATLDESFPAGPIVVVGDTLYYFATGPGGIDLVALVPGAEPAAVVKSPDVTAYRLWTDGTSLFWTTSRGLAHVPLAGGDVVDGPASPPVSDGQGFAIDATNLYTLTKDNPSAVVARSLATGQVRTLQTLPEGSGGALYDQGDHLLVVSDVSVGDQLAHTDVYSVPKDGSPLKVVRLSADAYAALAVHGGELLGESVDVSLKAFNVDGTERSLFPDAPFSAHAAAYAADGTAYVSGNVGRGGDIHPAFAVVSPGGEATLLQCGATQRSEDDGPYVDTVVVGASATYGFMTPKTGGWDLVKLPR
jgi:hypothetical protein